MFNFEDRTGPFEALPLSAYPARHIPEWYLDAKLGFFIHLGLYSIPAWAYRAGGPFAEEDGQYTPTELAYARHRYAEWYGNTWRLPGSPCRTYHQATFGVGTNYEDFAERFAPDPGNLNHLIDSLVGAGGRYIVPTTKHHDGFCLWETATTSFSCAHRAGVDVIDAIVARTRRLQARVGLYFSGALDWHVSDFPPINSDTDLFMHRRNDAAYSRYAARQLGELVERYAPDLLWNDIDWPDGGKGPEEYGLARILGDYLRAVPHGVVNDRWGIPYHGFRTREYSHVPDILPGGWEATRGLGQSFGINRNEDPGSRMSNRELTGLLVDVCAKGGNLLINVGPQADGSLDEDQTRAVVELGSWMAEYGSLIYGSRPWRVFTSETAGDVRYLSGQDDDLAVFVRDRSTERLRLPADAPRRTATWWVNGQRITARVDTHGSFDVPPATSDTPIALVLT